MRNVVIWSGLVATVLLLIPLSAKAQNSGIGVFGGYSFSRPDGQNLNGWHLTIGTKEGGEAGVSFRGLADFSGHYGPATTLHTFMVGGEVELGFRPFILFYHYSIGAGHETSKLMPGAHRRTSRTGLAQAIGGGVELPLNDWVSFRLVQADYLPIYYFGDGLQNNMRLSSGVIFRFK